MSLFWTFILTSVISYLGGFVAKALLTRYGIVDRPNERSSHDKPVIRGGGVAVLFSAAVVSCLAVPTSSLPRLAWIALAGLVVAVVSFFDDLRSLPQVLRLGVHAGAALIALWVLGFAGQTSQSLPIAAFLAVVCFLWIVGYINAFNFMDGINGMAGMQLVVTGLGTALVGMTAGESSHHPAIILAFILAGSGAGFLPHNFPRARMFLGDVGSAPLGYFLAVLAVWLARDLEWWLLGAFGLLQANFILDTAITFARRTMRGEKSFEPHREHFYQLLVRAGKSHQFVTRLECLIQLLVLCIVLVAVDMDWAARITAAATVVAMWLAFFGYAESKYRTTVTGGNIA